MSAAPHFQHSELLALDDRSQADLAHERGTLFQPISFKQHMPNPHRRSQVIFTHPLYLLRATQTIQVRPITRRRPVIRTQSIIDQHRRETNMKTVQLVPMTFVSDIERSIDFYK